MTPEQAREVLKHAELTPIRARRYELEGGLMQYWQCKTNPSHCDWCAVAETAEDARREVEKNPRSLKQGCGAEGLRHTMVAMGVFSPPGDFS